MTTRFQTLSAPDLGAALAAARLPVLIDVRSLAEYERGHLPGARHAPVHELAHLRSRLPSGLAERIVVIGDDRERVVAAANFLALLGYGDVAVLDGGIAAWTGPLERGPPGDCATPGGGRGPKLRIVRNNPAPPT